MNLQIIISGILGTLAMTLFVELVALILKKPFHVVSILSCMLRFGKRIPLPRMKYLFNALALLLHYAIGISFSYGFKLFLDINLLELTWSHALLFGLIAGIIGITGWRIFFAIHPSPPSINLFQYLTTIFLGHLIFSMGQFYSYVKLLPDLVQAMIPIC